MPLRVRKVIGSFEKRASGSLVGNSAEKKIGERSGLSIVSSPGQSLQKFLTLSGTLNFAPFSPWLEKTAQTSS